MEWYYAENNERRGPVTEAEFSDLVKSGRVTATTQVWRQGWPEWKAFDEAGDLTSSAAPGTANCAECGLTFSTSEMVQYGNAWVCPNCKPVFFQKVKEGIEPSSSAGLPQYAGFWIRFLAKFIDGIVLGIPGYALQFGAMSLFSEPQKGYGLLIGWVLSMALQIAYNTVLVGKYGATLGKMACGLRIVRANGGPVGYGLACGRYFAEIVSALTLYIGYLMAAFDDEKRTLHDRICNTRVIRSRA